jgi:hypothetical protein
MVLRGVTATHQAISWAAPHDNDLQRLEQSPVGPMMTAYLRALPKLASSCMPLGALRSTSMNVNRRILLTLLTKIHL